MAQVFYIVATIVAIGFIVAFLLSRGSRTVRFPHDPSAPNQVRGGSRTGGGGWRDGGIGGIGYGQDYRGPTRQALTKSPQRTQADDSRPQPAATMTGCRSGGDDEVVDQLPKYEASPPGYDTLYKYGERQEVGAVQAEVGGSSAANDPPHDGAATVGVHRVEQRSGDAVINIELPPQQYYPQSQPQHPSMWSRLAGRLNP